MKPFTLKVFCSATKGIAVLCFMQLCCLGCLLHTENGGSVTAGCIAPSTYTSPIFPLPSLHVSARLGLLEGVRYIYHTDKACAPHSKEKIKLVFCKIIPRARYDGNIGHENCHTCISFTYKTHCLVPVCSMKIFEISVQQLLSLPTSCLFPHFSYIDKKSSILPSSCTEQNVTEEALTKAPEQECF